VCSAAGNTDPSNDNDQSNRYPAGFAYPGNVAVANMNEAGDINYDRCRQMQRLG
jgi:hypothetical protein